jgi:hypothetical protein
MDRIYKLHLGQRLPFHCEVADFVSIEYTIEAIVGESVE